MEAPTDNNSTEASQQTQHESIGHHIVDVRFIAYNKNPDNNNNNNNNNNTHTPRTQVGTTHVLAK
jgi:hypothetical protein